MKLYEHDFVAIVNVAIVIDATVGIIVIVVVVVVAI